MPCTYQKIIKSPSHKMRKRTAQVQSQLTITCCVITTVPAFKENVKLPSIDVLTLHAASIPAAAASKLLLRSWTLSDSLIALLLILMLVSAAALLAKLGPMIRERLL